MKLKLHAKGAIVAALLVTGGVARAADLPSGYAKAPPMLYDWSGFYLGGNVGGAFSEENTATPFGSWSPNSSGVIAGGQLGYDFTLSANWLIGIEGEIDWTSAQGTVVIPNPADAVTFTSNHNWYGALEGRLGFFQGPWLFYAKGGVAWINADYRMTGSFNGVTAGQSVTNTGSGWTLGAGLEYMWAPGWSAKVEYDFLDFGNRTVGFGSLGSTIGLNTDVHEVKIGVNWHFSSGSLFGGF